MTAPSYVTNVHLNDEQISILLVCLEGTNINDMSEEQDELRVKLARLLEKREPDWYRTMVDRGLVTHWRERLAANLTTKERDQIVREHIRKKHPQRELSE